MRDYGHYMGEPYEVDKTTLELRQRDRRIINMIRSFMDRSSKYREPHLELARDSREAYENWRPSTRSMIGRANLKLPIGFTIIESQIPQLMEIFFKDPIVVEFKGQGADDAEWENLITDFHAHQFEEMGFQVSAAAFKKSMLLDGTAIAKVPYRFIEKDIVQRNHTINPKTGEPVVEKTIVPMELYSGPFFEVVPIYDFFPDWSVKKPGDIEAMRGVVHRMFKTVTALKTSKLYKNIDEVERSLGTKGEAAWSAPYYESDDFKKDFEDLQDNVTPGIKDPGRVELWEYWGLFDASGKGDFEEYLITVANGDVVIRVEPNPYDLKFKPFVACPNIIRENEFYGIPELSAVKPLIKENNTLRNAKLDAVNVSVNPMWIVDRAAGIPLKSLFSRPHGVILTNDMDGIKPLTQNDPAISAREELTIIQQDIQNATAQVSSMPQLTQLSRSLGRTASGVNFLQNIAGNRISIKAKLLSELLYKKLAWIMLMTNRQFVDEEKWVRVSDPNSPNVFQILPLDAFVRRYDFSPRTLLDTGGIELQFQKLEAATQILQVAEQSQPGITKFDVLYEALLRPLLGRQVKRFTRTEEERMQMQQQKLAMEQATNAAQGQAAPQPNAGTGAQPVMDPLALMQQE